MAVDLMFGHRTNPHSSSSSSSSSPPFTSLMEETAVKEAASGLDNVENLIRLLSLPQPSSPSTADVGLACRVAADAAVTKFNKVISLLGKGRTGHARFRRGPIANPTPALTPVQIQEPPAKVYHATPIHQILPPLPQPLPLPAAVPVQSQIPLGIHMAMGPSPATTISFSYGSGFGNNVNNTNTGSFVTSLTGDNEEKPKQAMSMSSGSGFQITNVSVSAGKPPLSSSSSFKRKCSSDTVGSAGKCGSSASKCHCTKKRKMKSKRVVRVPAISLKMADIPPDEFSWRKYGQKPIKGSPFPRGYYKCSSVRGCPARKHVERALDEPTMLVVTYEGDHNHSLSVADSTSSIILESS
ncbi:hypothetical protein MLD38_004585 [Melastoma candidum]|uniref:Uncharacterized protein n=1 Tax=Melastoma candidum TaxID=119954 RepID=A0ACB9S7H9_9MYRT|nr:hypothetical protein MLD38_004585 [Melastoma candidum]